jgi:tetratricopeptide (TPR) repeat protein
LYVDQIAESEAALSATADQVHHSPHLKALHRTTLGALRQRQDRHDEARVAYAEALALRRQMGDERRVLIMLLNLADLAFSSGDVQAAIDHGLEAMAEAERQTDSALLGVILGNLATAWLSLRQVEPAQAAMLRAVPLLRNGEGMVYFIDTLAWLAAQQGRLAESAGLLGHADGALLALGVVRQPSEQRVVSAVLQELAGQTDAESLARWRAQGKAWTEVQALGCALPQLSP